MVLGNRFVCLSVPEKESVRTGAKTSAASTLRHSGLVLLLLMRLLQDVGTLVEQVIQKLVRIVMIGIVKQLCRRGGTLCQCHMIADSCFPGVPFSLRSLATKRRGAMTPVRFLCVVI